MPEQGVKLGLDLGRHILAKGFGRGVTEYKQIARELRETHVLDAERAGVLELLAGYRNRMVHFYHEIEPRELYRICREDLYDIRETTNALRVWIGKHQGYMNDDM